jgi:hypothetical protein
VSMCIGSAAVDVCRKAFLVAANARQQGLQHAICGVCMTGYLSAGFMCVPNVQYST